MEYSPDPAPHKFWTLIDRIGSLAGVGGLIVTAVFYALSWPPILLVFIGGVSLGVLLLWLVAHTLVSNTQPLDTASLFQGEPIPWRAPIESPLASHVALPSSPIHSVEPKSQRHVSLEELEEEYEIKKLEPNLQPTKVEPDSVAARYDEQGIIVVQPNPNADDGFSAYVIPIGNTGRSKVGQANKVRAQITFRSLRSDHNGTVHRGAWLSEKETEIDFPPNCSPRRLILVTVEGDAPRLGVFSISRDFDSGYKGLLTMREELHGEIYEFKVALFDEKHTTKPLNRLAYILEIGHLVEGAFSASLSNAYFWKSRHLTDFVSEGIALGTKVHEIWKYAREQVPMPERPDDTIFRLSLSRALTGEEPFDYTSAYARIEAIEHEEEEKLLGEIADWQTRTANFLGLIFGSEVHDKFVESVPSIQEGFERQQKRWQGLLPRLRAKDGTVEKQPPSLPYWRLSDAIYTRTDRLMKMIEDLR